MYLQKAVQTCNTDITTLLRWLCHPRAGNQMESDAQNVLTGPPHVSNFEWFNRLLDSASQFGTSGSGGDVSVWFTRLFQLGALGSILQFLGITSLVRWVFDSLHEYITSQFVLQVFLSGDEIPCLYVCCSSYYERLSGSSLDG